MMKRNIKVIHILELVWLAILIISLLTGIYLTFTKGWEKAQIYFGFSVIAFVFYFLRRRERLKMQEKNSSDG